MRIKRKRARRLGFSLAAYMIGIIIGQLVFAVIIQNFFPMLSDSSWSMWLLISGSNYLLGVPLFFFLTRKLPDGKLPRRQRFTGMDLIRYTTMSLAIGYIFSFLGNVLNQPFVDRYGISPNVVEDMLRITEMPMTILFIVILAPVFEENVFRKRFLSKALPFGKRKAVFAGALAFGLFHLNIPQFCYAFALGVFWGILFLKYGKITPLILLHMIVNALGSVVFPKLLLSDLPQKEIIAGSLVLVVIVVGIMLLAGERKKLALILAEDDELPQTENGGEILQNAVRKKEPSLIWNAGYLVYLFIVLTIFYLSLIGPDLVERVPPV